MSEWSSSCRRSRSFTRNKRNALRHIYEKQFSRNIIQLREIGNLRFPFRGSELNVETVHFSGLKIWTLVGVTEEGCSSLVFCCNRRRCHGDRADPRNRCPRNGYTVNRAISADGPDECCNGKIYNTRIIQKNLT